MTTDDPRWRRGNRGWWHWPDGATEWQWVPDPYPPTPDEVAAEQNREQALAHYDNAIGHLENVNRIVVWSNTIWLWGWIAVAAFVVFVLL